MRFFPAAQEYFNFYLMALFEEFFRHIFLNFQIMRVSPEADADALHVNRFLFGLIDPILLGLLVLVFAIIHYFADGRLGHRGDFHQIKFLLPGDLQGVKRSHDPELVARVIDHADLRNPDLLIDPGERAFFYEGPSGWYSSNGFVFKKLI